jgi:hypothetical protein
MRPERIIALLAAASLVAACSSVDDWSGLKRRKDTTPVAQTDDGQVVAGYLSILDRLGRGGAAEQAEIVESTRSAYLAEPSTQKRLRYAFVLAVPGHAASDPAGARTLLGDAPATTETLLPSERALADLMVLNLDARLALTSENETLRNGRSAVTVDSRLADLDRRLQAETAEKERLKRDLERAEAKLEAIATLEGGQAPPRP